MKKKWKSIAQPNPFYSQKEAEEYAKGYAYAVKGNNIKENQGDAREAGFADGVFDAKLNE